MTFQLDDSVTDLRSDLKPWGKQEGEGKER